MKDRIIKSLDPDLLQLIETGQLRLRTLKELKELKKPRRDRPGIYIHVMHNPNDLDVIGIYIGSTMYLLRRPRDHKRGLKSGRISKSKRKRKTKARSHSFHQQFWAKQGMQDFWLCFSELDLPKNARDADDMRLFLNILEKYTALLFRTLPRKSLQRGLPHGAKLNPYPWLGLNVLDPLQQCRSSSTTYKRTGVSFAYVQKPHSLLDIVFRYADPSKGDRGEMPLRCSRCLISGHRVDRTSRYEIPTGVYLAHLRLRCHTCSPDKEVLFIPADTSIPFKHFTSAVYAYKMARNRQQATEMKVQSQADIEAMNFLQLKTWIKSQGFCSSQTRKGDLNDRANSIRKWLMNPKVYRRPKDRSIKPEAVKSREDLDNLSNEGLAAWIKSRGYMTSGRHRPRAYLLDIARQIYDNPEVAHSGRIFPKDVQSRGDLDRLSNTGVVNWMRSKGYPITSNKANEPRAELLDIARKVWDNPKKRLSLDLEFKQKVTPAKHSNKIKTPQTRPDLARINYRNL